MSGSTLSASSKTRRPTGSNNAHQWGRSSPTPSAPSQPNHPSTATAGSGSKAAPRRRFPTTPKQHGRTHLKSRNTAPIKSTATNASATAHSRSEAGPSKNVRSHPASCTSPTRICTGSVNPSRRTLRLCWPVSSLSQTRRANMHGWSGRLTGLDCLTFLETLISCPRSRLDLLSQSRCTQMSPLQSMSSPSQNTSNHGVVLLETSPPALSPDLQIECMLSRA